MDLIDYLNQDSVWMSNDGTSESIDGMGDVWRRNASRWMINHAESLWVATQVAALTRGLAAVSSIFGAMKIESDLVRTLSEISRPDQWVKSTPLYRALQATNREPLQKYVITEYPKSPAS